MRKFLIILLFLFFTVTSVSAATIPDNVTNYIKNSFPKAEIRFDGLITINDTLYLPLYPAKSINVQKFEIKKTIPEGKTLKDLPDILVFNNDFVLLKIIETVDGKKKVLFQKEPFIEVKTGLLPQDLLVPKGLIIPDNIKTIIGGLKIATEQDKDLKIKSDFSDEKPITTEVKSDIATTVPQLKNKLFYITTYKSKNIHVIPSNKTNPSYALSVDSIPLDIKIYKGFLLVTAVDINAVNIISLADEAVIKCIELPEQPEQILIDNINRKAYISAPEASSIYVLDLITMQLKQKIQVNGWCDKLYLTPDGTKLIYVDRKTNDVWSVELNNDYTIKEVGTFPNISSIAYSENKIYLSSRTKNRLAIVDYATMSLIREFEVSPKPVDMLVYYGNLFILSAETSIVQVLNTQTDKLTNTIKLNTNGFATKITRIDGTNLAVITGAVAGKYSVINLAKKQVIKTLPINIPITKIAITEQVRKINK